MSKGYSGYFKGTRGDKASAGSTDYMDQNDNFSKFIKNRADVDVNGFYDVIAHGSNNSIQIHSNGSQVVIDHRSAARLFKNDPLIKGKSIRLLSCETGASANGFAQNLANKLNVVVEAPTKLVWAYPDGRSIVADRSSSNPYRPDLSKKGKFIKFYPGGKKR